MFAWDMAPGIGRKFAISDLPIADAAIETAMRKDLLARVDFSRRIRIWGSDSDGAIIEAAKANMLRAEALAKGICPDNSQKKTVTIKIAGARPIAKGIAMLKKPVHARFSHQPTLRVLSMETTSAPETEGFLVTNPPYGRRIGDPADAEAIYQRMGELMRRFPAWKIAVITDHPGFESHFGHKADMMRQVTNGAFQTYLYVFNNESPIGLRPKPQIEPATETEQSDTPEAGRADD
jgi:putative N6-adenine-specific DNA methylase